jgi:hypothetical protein
VHVTAHDAALGPGGIWIAIANIWFVSWAVRHRGELDHELDSTAKFIRWMIAIVCLGVAVQFPQLLNLPPVRVCVGFLGVAFLVWPNLAYYLTRFLHLLRILPNQNSEKLDYPE